jgi:hypothetical protein
VKLGRTSEYARQQVKESGTPFTGQLLENYTVTPDTVKQKLNIDFKTIDSLFKF